MKRIYLDYAAATPLAPEVLQAMEPYFSENFYNPSATYLAARSVKNQLGQARQTVAEILGAKPAEIVFTAGATEANNLAIQGVMSQYRDGEVLVSSIEHESVLEPAKLFKCRQIPVDKNGRIILNKLSNLLSDKTVLVSIMLVNNELGTIQPLREIANLLKMVRKQRQTAGNKTPLYLHSDSAQAANYLDLHVNRLGVDMMSLNGGKIYGPKQSGALYVRTGVEIKPLIVGGGQESGRRSGTENLAGSIGLATALQMAQSRKAKESERLTKLRGQFEDQLAQRLPGAIINGDGAPRAPHLCNLTLPGTDNERLMMELDERGIQCAVGSACSASKETPSHVLAAIGLDDKTARSTLRFSLGRQTTKSDIDKTVLELSDLIAKIPG